MQRKKPLGSGLEDRVGDGPDVECEGPGAGRTTTAALEKWLDFLLVFIYLFIYLETGSQYKTQAGIKYPVSAS